MNAGERVRISAAYGERWPRWRQHVGLEGVVLDPAVNWHGEHYVRAALDADDGRPGLFLPDELEPVT